jgi:hypothetical protein
LAVAGSINNVAAKLNRILIFTLAEENARQREAPPGRYIAQKRSSFITFVQAETKSTINFSLPSLAA